MTGSILQTGFLQLLENKFIRTSIPQTARIEKCFHNEKLESWLTKSICVYLGQFEPFGIVALEAAACGLPVIIAKSDWTAHYIEYSNGFSIKTGDICGLALVLSKLAQNNMQRKSMGLDSRRLVEDKLSWKKIVDQCQKVYELVKNIN